MFAAYHDAVARLMSLQNLEAPWKHNDPASLRASFVRLQQLLDRLGNPEAAMRYIHVTGTSGKGSVTKLVHDMLRADGRTVASYYSPHTTTLLERYRINDKLIAPDDLVDAIDDVLAAYQSHVDAGLQPLTFFELTTAVAFVAFANAEVEWCVLEVGLGGRYDSTNIIPHKDVAVITNISLDHTDVLGNTVEKIANEKAGIIIPGCEVVTGVTQPSAKKLIADAARKAYAPVTFVRVPKGASHHLANALLAAAAAQLVGVPMDVIERVVSGGAGSGSAGETTRRLPCRFETMQTQPTVIIDGAHNVAKMQTTIAQLPKNTTVIFGCKEDKDAKLMLRALSKVATTIHTTRYTNGRGKPANPATLLAMVPKAKRGSAFLFAHDAVSYAVHNAKPSDVILTTGSLYLAGEVRTRWVSEEQILKDQES